MTDARVLSDQTLARLYLLELAYTDCFALKEFSGNLDAILPGSLAAKRAAERSLVAELAESGALRVHTGPQCGPEGTPEEATIRPEDMGTIPDEAFEPYSEAFVCICPTERSESAYNALFVELGSPDWHAEMRKRGVPWG